MVVDISTIPRVAGILLQHVSRGVYAVYPQIFAESAKSADFALSGALIIA